MTTLTVDAFANAATPSLRAAEIAASTVIDTLRDVPALEYSIFASFDFPSVDAATLRLDEA